VKRQPKDATSPPNTAASRVLFCLQNAIHIGEKRSDTDVEVEARKPANEKIF